MATQAVKETPMIEKVRDLSSEVESISHNVLVRIRDVVAEVVGPDDSPKNEAIDRNDDCFYEKIYSDLRSIRFNLKEIESEVERLLQ